MSRIAHRSIILGVVLLAGCDTSTDPIIVTGGWSGTLSLTAGSSVSTPLNITLLQFGSGVTGTFTYTASSRTGTVSGMLEDRRLELSVTPDSRSTDDCGQYSMELTFTISGNVLTATGGSGTYCNSGVGGSQVGPFPVTAATGTLNKI
jgi:hypothetical protein